MKTFTVDVAGPEREDGEAPYAVVVDAVDEAEAGKLGVEWRKSLDPNEREENVVLVSVIEGVPGPACGFAWNDARE